jgi:hypothetical protein
VAAAECHQVSAWFGAGHPIGYQGMGHPYLCQRGIPTLESHSSALVVKSQSAAVVAAAAEYHQVPVELGHGQSIGSQGMVCPASVGSLDVPLDQGSGSSG